jgi:HEAT repeat protein
VGPFTDAVHALLTVLPRSRTAKRGWNAIGALEALGPHAAPAVPRFVSMLKVNDERCRRWAVRALGEIGPAASPAIEPLCDQFLAAWRAGQWDGDAATTLMLIGDVRVVPVLATAARMGGWEFYLNQWIQVDFDDRGKEASAAVPVLLRMLDTPEFQYNRLYTLCWIQRFHKPGDPVPADFSGLRRALGDSRPDICGEAARAAGMLGNAMKSLLPDVREACTAGRFPKSDCPIDEIIAALEGNPVPFADWLRAEAEEKKWRRGGFRNYRQWGGWARKEDTCIFAKVVPHLLRVVLQGNTEDRSRALHSLTAIGPDAAPAVPLLLELLRRAETAATCDDLANALGAIGSEEEEAVPALVQLLLKRHSAGDEESADRAARALRYIGSPQAIAALIEALDGPDTYWMRSRVVGALAGLGQKAIAAIPRLEALLLQPAQGTYGPERIREALRWIDPSRRK